jgi:exo-beta-1,3-glucanase (GH17 family)
MRLPFGLFLISASAIVAIWSWLGMPVQMAASPLAPDEKLNCLSYAPFMAGQSPFDDTTRITASQIDDDMTRLAGVTRCLRTYSTDLGLENVPPVARRHGLKVLQGVWLSREAENNRVQMQTAVDLAKQYPDTITGIVVGNEVLLRGEISAADLIILIRAVKSQVAVPITYADVWEFWVRHPDISGAVDFITIHILPYWEDVPVRAKEAAAYLAAIRRKVAGIFPNKEILIGETGWPSAGRMRDGALPSPVNQASVIHDILATAKREDFRVNLIEAYDQPWKRYQEGTVGGQWGLFDADSRQRKFAWGGKVSNYPRWPWQAAGGVVLAFLTFAAAFAAGRQNKASAQAMGRVWPATAALVLAPGILIGWAIENALVESLGIAGWIQSLTLVTACVAVPLLAAAAVGSGISLPSFAQVLGSAEDRLRRPLAWILGAALMVVTVQALQLALGLVFDPRYRDFAFAPLIASTVPYMVLALACPRRREARAAAEVVFAGALVGCAVFIALNEGFANWQALWFSAALVVLAFTLLHAPAAPG